MPWFQISDYQRVKMEWLIEADDADAAREKFLDSEGDVFIVTQSVEDSDGVSVEPWDGPAPDRAQAGHITDAAAELYRTLRAILPYAESRAEDMLDCAEETRKSGTPEQAAEEQGWADEAVAAVDAAKALLASLDAEG